MYEFTASLRCKHDNTYHTCAIMRIGTHATSKIMYTFPYENTYTTKSSNNLKHKAYYVLHDES